MRLTQRRLIIVRHGNTFQRGEPARRIGARTDMPLTAEGVRQAEALGRHFAGDGALFSRVLVGPLRRTRATADALCAQLVSAPQSEVAMFLAEIDHGPDENALEIDVVARIGADALSQWDTELRCPPGWIDDRDARLASWRTLRSELVADGGAILVVTSNGAARFALAAFALSTGDARLPTGSWGEIVFDETGAARLAEWGRRPPASST